MKKQRSSIELFIGCSMRLTMAYRSTATVYSSSDSGPTFRSNGAFLFRRIRTIAFFGSSGCRERIGTNITRTKTKILAQQKDSLDEE